MNSVSTLLSIVIGLGVFTLLWHAIRVALFTRRLVASIADLPFEEVSQVAWRGLYGSRLWHEDQWAQHAGFERAGACVLVDSLNVVWARDQGRELLVVRIEDDGICWQLLTVLAPRSCVTTSSGRDSLLLPRPEGRPYFWAAVASLDELAALHARHCETMERLAAVDLTPIRPIAFLKQLWVEQIELTQTVPLYPFRAVIWAWSSAPGSFRAT